MVSLPIIDISSLVNNTDKAKVAKEIGTACRENGFFYVINHGVDENLQKRLETNCKQFFALPLEVKEKLKITWDGEEWGGYFASGEDWTYSDKPDQKEGFFVTEEQGPDHPFAKNKFPYYGPSVIPGDYIPEFRDTLNEYITQLNALGHKIMEGFAISLGLDENYFYDRYTKHPTQILSILNYPPIQREIKPDEELWGIGEHTDYGFLTMIKQDSSGGLQVKSKSNWIDAIPIKNSFVCIISDMLDRLTGGLYKATVHRESSNAYKSFIFTLFFDPNYDAVIERLENYEVIFDDKNERWDRKSVHECSGNFGEHFLDGVANAFPTLKSKISQIQK